MLGRWRTAAALLFGLCGCEKIEDWLFDAERNHPQTLAAVEACVKKHGSTVVSIEASRLACAAKHQSTAAEGETFFITGSMYSDNNVDTGRNATVELRNNLTDFIVTSITIEILRDGIQPSLYATSTPIWLEPGMTLTVPLTFPQEVHFKSGGDWLVKWLVGSMRGVRMLH